MITYRERKELISRLAAIWEHAPELTLGQLIGNISEFKLMKDIQLIEAIEMNYRGNIRDTFSENRIDKGNGVRKDI